MSKFQTSGFDVDRPPQAFQTSDVQPTSDESVSAIIAELSQYIDVGFADIVLNGKCADMLTLMIAIQFCMTNTSPRKKDETEECINKLLKKYNFKDTVLSIALQIELGELGYQYTTDMKSINLVHNKKARRWLMVKKYRDEILNIKLANFRRISKIETTKEHKEKEGLLSTLISEQFPEVISESITFDTAKNLVFYRARSTDHWLSIATFTQILRVREVQKIIRYFDMKLHRLIQYAEEIKAFGQLTASSVYTDLTTLNGARNGLSHTELDCPRYGFPDPDGMTKEQFANTYKSVFEIGKQSVEEYFPGLQTKDLDFVKMEMIPKISIDEVHTVVAEYSRIVSELKDGGYTMEDMREVMKEYKDVSGKFSKLGVVANTKAELKRCVMCEPCSSCSKKVKSAVEQPPQTMEEVGDCASNLTESDLPSESTGGPLTRNVNV